MASREKRPLAPSKSRQKANNDSGLPSNEVRSKKGKSLPNLRHQQFARDIFEAVATGSQLPIKLEANLPRKKVLKNLNLKRKQRLRVTKTNFIKTKVTKKVTNKNLSRINSDIKKGIKAKRFKSVEREEETAEISPKISENHISDLENSSKATETTSKSAKNNLRTKKTKSPGKLCGELDSENIVDKEIDVVGNVSLKASPKLNKRISKGGETTDSASKGVKPLKSTGLKRNSLKEKENCTKIPEGDKYSKVGKVVRKGISLTKLRGVIKSEGETLENKSSIDLTIDEVIASMLSDSEVDNREGVAEKIEGKLTRSRKMLVDENIISDSEIKKEPDSDETRTSDGECGDVDQTNLVPNTIQLRKRSGVLSGQRSLRNGKLRQLSDSGVSNDIEVKKRRRLNSDEPTALDISGEHTSDGNVDTESCFSESSGNDSQTTVMVKEGSCLIKDEVSKNYVEGVEPDVELENNNNSERVDRIGEVGPTLRSKTKAKSTDCEMKNEEVKSEEPRISPKNAEVQEDTKRSISLDQVRKDTMLSKLSDRSKGRRNSLNIDMRKTVNSFYGTEKSDGNAKSQIDQMIENIKLTIAKSIESKIFGPEKGLGLSKNFEVPKIEEIIAPLSTESQKLGLEENPEEDKPNASKNEIKSENTENSVPRVADTAKEIEKLVMGDIELVETQSQNTQDSDSNTDSADKTHNVSESSHDTVNKDANDGKDVERKEKKEEQKEDDQSSSNTEIVNELEEENSETQSKPLDDNKKICVTRKLTKLVDKSFPETGESNKTNQTYNSNEIESCEGEITKCKGEKNHPSDSSSEKKGKDGIAADTSSKNSDNSNKTVTDVSNTSRYSEDSETLESISREVERLVAEGESSSQSQPSITSNTSRNRDMSCSDVNSDDKPKTDKDTLAMQTGKVVESESVIEKTEEPATSTSLLSNKPNQPDKGDSTNENVEATSESICNANTKVTSTRSTKGNTNFTEKELNDSSQVSKNSNVEKNTAPNESNVNEDGEKMIRSEQKTEEKSNKSPSEKNSEEAKVTNEENRRVLRVRDKQRKVEKRTASSTRDHIEKSSTGGDNQKEDTSPQHTDRDKQGSSSEDKAYSENSRQNQEMDNSQNELESQARTRRSREVKKRKEEQQQQQASNNSLRAKRTKREIRKSDQQKEETLLDNEVAKINENNRSFLSDYDNLAKRSDSFRGFSEGGRGRLHKLQENSSNLRSKSENDLLIPNEVVQSEEEGRLSSNLAEKERNNVDLLTNEETKSAKTPEVPQKDVDETSTSGESSSSMNITTKILETPEDKAKKESILRLLGLESLEKAAERLNHQKARKEQYSTGTLKTVIRVQKEKEKDKKRSRSPLKMVLKQGRNDGEGDSPEFYTIQKEFGTSGLGDSSSGANRKFTTNHRHSCDEDNEEAPPKDRQSLVIPEKSSSFSIHPGRLCADVCCYCFGKFGSLDTPMHLAQMKSDERRKKILNIERHLTKDSCLCDACYRHVDRKANTSPTNMQTKPQKQHRQLMVSKCSARDCRDPARHHVKRRWLLKIKAGLQNQVDIDWESSQHTSMSFCVFHYGKIERFLTCALCKRRLARNHTHQLANAETTELNQRLTQQGIPVILTAGTFVCKLCRYFTQLQLKYKDIENMNTNHRSFFKSYRKRILHYHDIEVLENEDEDSSTNQSKDKDKRKKAKCSQPKNGNSKSPDATTNSASEKSTPEPAKTEGTNSETDNENRSVKLNVTDDSIVSDVQYLGIENAVEKLKKRKVLDMNHYSSMDTSTSCEGSTNEVVEILAMDKEVTLTRLPKRAKTNNDITPVVQRLGANPSISVRTLFPGEEEMNLHANIEFTNVREITPQGWEKCATMIQYDRDTKLLWQELQRPYGNQSSFLRHLILLEKYYRSGDLILAPNASRNAINYSTSVQNRLISYEGPEKMDEPIMEPISSEFNNSRRLSGGYVYERDRLSTSNSISIKSSTPQPCKSSPRVLKLNPGVSIIKKPPPNLQRLNLPSTSASNGNLMKRRDGQKAVGVSSYSGGKVFQLSEPDFKRLQSLKKQKQMLSEKQCISPSNGSSSPNSPPSFKSTNQYQKSQSVAHSQFQKHLRMQQEMLNRQSRGDFEPLICDVRALNENSPTQNLLHNLNLPKSIQVTTKPPNPVPILPKIPKSLTVIPQTVTRPSEK